MVSPVGRFPKHAVTEVFPHEGKSGLKSRLPKTRCASSLLLLRRNHRSQRLAMLCAVGLALVSPRALAAAAMCDPIGHVRRRADPGASERDRRHRRAPKNWRRDDRDWVQTAHSGHRAPVLVKTGDTPYRVAAVPGELPALRGGTLPRPDAAQLPVHPGFSIPVYRPPRPCFRRAPHGRDARR